jgi:predicted homoserine dehydrogenase-like protein
MVIKRKQMWIARWHFFFINAGLTIIPTKHFADMKPLKKRLLSLKEDIRVAIIGCGEKGRALAYQVYVTPGMRPVAIADLKIEKAIEYAQLLNRDYEIVKSADALNRAIERGRLAITDNAEMVASSEIINVMIEASDAVAQAAVHALKAIQHHQHVVMMNAAADLMYGPLLLQMANEEGIVYTTCDGSYAAVLKKLIDDVDLWGLDLVMAGAITSNTDQETPSLKILRENEKPVFHHGNTPVNEAALQVSMALGILANGVNASAIHGAIHARHVNKIEDLLTHFEIESLWKNNVPVVNYLLSNELNPGAFVIAHTDQKFQQQMLSERYQLGPGPFYIFPRPFITGHLEAMECVMEAYFNGTARLHPYFGMKTNVFTYASADLRKGDILDRKKLNVSGRLENLEDNRHYAGLPICLAEGLKLRNDVTRGARITFDDVQYDSDDLAFSLYFRALQANTQKTILRKTKVVEDNLPYIIPMN